MKHLKRKFLKAWKANQEVVNVFDTTSIDDNANEKALSFMNEYAGNLYAIIRTEGNELIQAFEYNDGNKTYFIPEPNPIVTYFDMARQFHNHLIAQREKLFKELNNSPLNVYLIFSALNAYFAEATICVTFLFNSIEAFINLKIKDDIKYTWENKNGKIEILSKNDIVKKLPFKIKIKEVLPLSLGKSFHTDNSHKFEHILNLKSLRDDIMHTKTNLKKGPNFYSPLIIKTLNFDYEQVILSTRDFINFYENLLIEECDCGKDF